MEPVFAWCKGVKFVDLHKLFGSFEGTTMAMKKMEKSDRYAKS
jgi:hypothetical protein